MHGDPVLKRHTEKMSKYYAKHPEMTWDEGLSAEQKKELVDSIERGKKLREAASKVTPLTPSEIPFTVDDLVRALNKAVLKDAQRPLEPKG